MIRFDILTLFPTMFYSPFKESIIKRAMEKNIIEINVINLRDYASGKHRVTDDYPYGGGGGMIMKVEPIVKAIGDLKSVDNNSCVILLSPIGKRFNQEVAKRFSVYSHIILVCGRYEGVDERVRQYFIDEEISIGDYILTGGELAAMVILDAVVRLIPGVLGCSESAINDSFSSGLVEYPQYTRPREFMGYSVPDVLLSGDHKKISEYRKRESLKRTLIYRPEILKNYNFTSKDLIMMKEIKCELGLEYFKLSEEKDE